MKQKQRTTHKRNFKSLKKTLSSTLLAGAILTPASQAAGRSETKDLTIPQRIDRVRTVVNNHTGQDLINQTSLSEESSSEDLPQWGNWVNWSNWGNWGNWSNWNNWSNWGNWANQWGNWGNF